MPYHDELAIVSLIWTTKAVDWPSEMAVNTFHVHHKHFTANPFDWDANLQALADGVRDKLVSHWGAIGGMFGSGYGIGQVKAAQLDATGKWVAEKVSVVDAGALAGSAAQILPPEVSVCLSLFGYDPTAFVPHRGRHRGRMYLPYIDSSLAGPNGKIRSTIMGDYLTGWTAFFNDVQGMHETPDPGVGNVDYWQLVIPSRVDASMTQVRHVGYGDHFASQRRRQHQTPEAYSWANVNFTEAADDPNF